MPFITEPLDDVHEPTPAPEDEYEVRIVKAEPKEAKSGRDMLVLTFVFTDKTLEAPPFQHFLLKWTDSDDADQVHMRKLDVKRFCDAFDLPLDFEPEDCVGQVASLFVTQEEGDDGVVRNRARFPRLKE